jgi:D-glycero-D-manno-heptose 1,7-bisphosphate phosphatase
VYEHQVDLAKSYVVGDQTTDIVLAHRLNLPSVLVLTGFGRESLRQLQGAGGPTPTHVASDLLSATEWILMRSGAK